MDRRAWQDTVHGVIRVRHDLVTEINNQLLLEIQSDIYPHFKNHESQYFTY